MLTAGDQLGIIDFDFGKIGIDVLFIPAAFYRPRQDQWKVLVRAAALHNQTYVVAVNQHGRNFFGSSCVADPSGIITNAASDGEGYFYGVLDLEYQQNVRKENQTTANRRPELYK